MKINWTKTFRIVWRINAIAILGVVSLAIFTLITALSSEFLRSHRRSQNLAPNLAPKESGKPELKLGSFQRVNNSAILRSELCEVGDRGISSYKGGSGLIHNVLFLDIKDGKSWWLLPDSASTIDSEFEFKDPDNQKDSLIANIYHVTPDPNNNPDQSYLLLANPSGEKLLKLATGQLRIDESTTITRTEGVVLYHDLHGYHIIRLNPTEITKSQDIISKIEFPKY